MTERPRRCAKRLAGTVPESLPLAAGIRCSRGPWPQRLHRAKLPHRTKTRWDVRETTELGLDICSSRVRSLGPQPVDRNMSMETQAREPTISKRELFKLRTKEIPLLFKIKRMKKGCTAGAGSFSLCLPGISQALLSHSETACSLPFAE